MRRISMKSLSVCGLRGLEVARIPVLISSRGKVESFLKGECHEGKLCLCYGKP